MPLFHAKTPLDKAFEISLLLKGLDGLAETVSGILFLFVKPQWILDLAHGLVGYQPHGFIGRHVLGSAENFGKGAAIFASLYLLSHGVVKLVLIVAILRERAWGYLGLVLITIAFVIYQLYHLIFGHFGFTFTLLTIFDLVVIYLTAKEYGRQKENFAKRHHARERPETE